MSTICPDNSTECLLRAVLDTQSGFNWNSANFIVTLLIGILALFFAMATVFQALLMAGPGRVKASKAAIGPYWSEKARTRFDWREMRFRTTAKVPLIRDLAQLPGNDSLGLEIRTYPARWYTLLQNIGIGPSDLAPDDSGGPSRRSKLSMTWTNIWARVIDDTPKYIINEVEIDADHLPSDLMAVPAWTTVRVAVQLAVLAGCDTVQIPADSSYPIARGVSCQLRFREHPDLGSIAIFDQLLRTRVYFPPSIKSMWDWWLSSDYGLTGGSYFDDTRTLDNRDMDPASINKRVLNLSPAGCGHHFCKSYIFDTEKRETLMLMPFVSSASPSLRILNTDPKRYVEILQVLFSILGTIQDRKDYVAHGRTLLRSEVSKAREEDFAGFVGDRGDVLPGSTQSNSLFRQPATSADWNGSSWLTCYRQPRWQPKNHLFSPDEMTIDPLACSLCRGITILLIGSDLEDCTAKVTKTLKANPRNRAIIQAQLQEIDWWLGEERLRALSCCSMRAFMFEVSIEKLEEEKGLGIAPDGPSTVPAPHPAPTHPSPDPTSSPLPIPAPIGTTAQTQPPTSPQASAPVIAQEGSRELEVWDSPKRMASMRSLLYFRAVLWTAYVLTATDLSFLNNDNEIGDRIVQML